MKRPPVHLWVYNHPFVGISDQVAFTVSCLRQHGYTVTVGRRPFRTSLNLVIENFSYKTRTTLVEFCRTFQKRVAVIMTEHIDWNNGRLWFHGLPIGADNDYMHPRTMINRLRCLLQCLPYIRCFMRLGDLPVLQGITTLLPGITVRSLPFPMLRHSLAESSNRETPPQAVLFTGAMTSFRHRILETLRSHGIEVVSPGRFLSRKCRNDMNRMAKVILNIPQRPGWMWLSSMRIIAGLVSGRPTISLGTRDTSRIASCCTQVDMAKPDWIATVRHSVAHWTSLYQRDLERYNAMAEEFERDHPFPHDFFEMWSVTEGLWQ